MQGQLQMTTSSHSIIGDNIYISREQSSILQNFGVQKNEKTELGEMPERNPLNHKPDGIFLTKYLTSFEFTQLHPIQQEQNVRSCRTKSGYEKVQYSGRKPIKLRTRWIFFYRKNWTFLESNQPFHPQSWFQPTQQEQKTEFAEENIRVCFRVWHRWSWKLNAYLNVDVSLGLPFLTAYFSPQTLLLTSTSKVGIISVNQN